MTYTVPLKNVTALSIAKSFVEFWILRYGPPAVVVTDNGSQIPSKLCQFACRMLRVKNAFTATYHPQTNGQAERFNRSLLAGLRAFVSDHSELVTYAYNAQVQASTGVATFHLVLSESPM